MQGENMLYNMFSQIEQLKRKTGECFTTSSRRFIEL